MNNNANLRNNSRQCAVSSPRRPYKAIVCAIYCSHVARKDVLSVYFRSTLIICSLKCVLYLYITFFNVQAHRHQWWMFPLVPNLTVRQRRIVLAVVSWIRCVYMNRLPVRSVISQFNLMKLRISKYIQLRHSVIMYTSDTLYFPFLGSYYWSGWGGKITRRRCEAGPMLINSSCRHWPMMADIKTY